MGSEDIEQFKWYVGRTADQIAVVLLSETLNSGGRADGTGKARRCYLTVKKSI
jgi:hypothetical protein